VPPLLILYFSDKNSIAYSLPKGKAAFSYFEQIGATSLMKYSKGRARQQSKLSHPFPEG
jgi:hypothetical protein